MGISHQGYFQSGPLVCPDRSSSTSYNPRFSKTNLQLQAHVSLYRLGLLPGITTYPSTIQLLARITLAFHVSACAFTSPEHFPNPPPEGPMQVLSIGWSQLPQISPFPFVHLPVSCLIHFHSSLRSASKSMEHRIPATGLSLHLFYEPYWPSDARDLLRPQQAEHIKKGTLND